jgi:hypothetical protein
MSNDEVPVILVRGLTTDETAKFKRIEHRLIARFVTFGQGVRFCAGSEGRHGVSLYSTGVTENAFCDRPPRIAEMPFERTLSPGSLCKMTYDHMSESDTLTFISKTI